MSNSTGEAGWQTTPQAALSNQRYGLTFWQNGSAYVYAYVAITLTNGSLQYISLMSVPATQNTGWSQYSDVFITPANTSTIQLTIATSEPGSFSLDDVYVNTLTNQTPAYFNKGMVTLTFDDGEGSAYTNGYNELSSLGLQGTFYLNASTLGTSGYMSKTQVLNLAKNNQEIGSHEYQHIDMVPLSQAQLVQQINSNNSALIKIIGTTYPIVDFASPYGSYTSTTLNTVMQYYQSHRTTDNQFNTKANLNVRQIHAKLVTNTTTVNQVDAWIDQANQQNEWLVLVYHAIGASAPGGDGSGYATTPIKFNAEMQYLKNSGVVVSTMKSALTALLPQIN
jgi:peptidoglycan/xylan/chitin deacetylase (PgdA/CDA1 family)